MRCLIYSRVSTDAQERDGTSLDTQERACRDFALSRGWSIVAELRDAASGFTLERPELLRARQLAGSGQVDVFLCYALDRLSRKQTHVAILVEEMEENGVSLDFVTENFEDTATGQLLRSVKAFAAEFEREKIAERTMRGKAERARSGRLPQATGRGLFGYNYDSETGRRDVNPIEAPIVVRIFEAFAEGQSIIGIANSLNADSIPTKQGKTWSPATLFHLLRNQSYRGHTTYRRTQAIKVRDTETGKKKRKVVVRPETDWIDVPGATPALVSASTYTAVQRRLDDPERLRMGRRKSTYGLSGHLKCRVCGSSMVGQTLRGQYRYYRCRRAFAGPKVDRCSSTYVRADGLETKLLEEVAGLMARPEVVLNALEARRTFGTSAEETSVLSTRLDSLARQRDRLLKLFQLGEIDEEYLQREMKPLTKERERIQAELEAKQVPETVTLPDGATLDAICRAVSTWLVARGREELPTIAKTLQLSVRAQRDSAEVDGVLPEYASVCEHADVRSMVSTSRTRAGLAEPVRERRKMPL